MARFSIDAEVDVEVDEFLDECDQSEIEEVIEWLRDNEYLVGGITTLELVATNFSDDEFNSSLTNLIGNRFKMSVADEQAIVEISKKYC